MYWFGDCYVASFLKKFIEEKWVELKTSVFIGNEMDWFFFSILQIFIELILFERYF